MPWLSLDAKGVEVDVAPATVAVLQNEAEVARTPAQDLTRFLADSPWTVRHFDERTFGGMLGSPSPYDAMVLGYNAVAFSDAVREHLDREPPVVPLLVLHQLRPDCYGFLRERLALRLHPVPGAAAERALVPPERDAADEVLLQFPQRVRLPGGEVRARAIRWFSFAPGSGWRVVLEARHGTRRLPVLIRTSQLEPQRVVACSLLLEPRNPDHARLLRNLLAYVASGWPEVGVLDTPGPHPDHYRPEAITRKLRIQGARAIRVRAADGRSLGFDRWPLRGVGRLVYPKQPALTSEAAAHWLAAGGVAVTVRSEQRVSVEAGSGDAEWAARRWATWFSGCPPARWQQSLFASRAVLRTLTALYEPGLDCHPERLEIRATPGDFRPAVAGLLAARVRHGNAEQTISATAAALDLHRLVGDALRLGVGPQVTHWLRGEFRGASIADRFDIARSLRDETLLTDAVARLADERRRKEGRPTLAERGGLNAVEVTRLREAALACGHFPDLGDAVIEAINGEQVARGLRSGSLRCAELLEPWARSCVAAPDHPLSRLSRELEAAALDGLAASGTLARADSDEVRESSGHDLSVETLALVRWLRREPGAALQIRPQSRELAVSAVSALLGEVERARNEEQLARRDVPALGSATLVLGAATLAVVAVALLGVFGVGGVSVSGATARAGALALGGALLLAAAVRWGLLRPDRLTHPERRDVLLAQALMTAVVVGAAAAAVAFLWKQAGNMAVGLLVLAVGAGVAVAALIWLSARDLAPPWAPRVLSIFGTPGGLLEWGRKRAEAGPPLQAGGQREVGEARAVEPPPERPAGR